MMWLGIGVAAVLCVALGVVIYRRLSKEVHNSPSIVGAGYDQKMQQERDDSPGR